MAKKTDGKGPVARIKSFTRAVQDGWRSLATGLGNPLKDKRKQVVVDHERVREMEAEHFYAADGLNRKIVERLPQDGTREWIKIKDPDSPDGTVKKVNDEMDRLLVQSRFKDAWDWARLYGGSALLMNVDDGLPTNDDGTLNLEKPLVLSRVREFKSLQLLNRHELTVAGTDITTDLDDANWGLPEFYRLQASVGGGKHQMGLIHHTRLIRFDGKKLPRRIFINNGYWHDSIFSGLRDVLADFNLGHASIAHVLQEFRIMVYKIKDLAEAFAAAEDGGEDAQKALLKRIETINMGKSVIGAYVLDPEEDITVLKTTVQGVAELLKAIKDRLQADLDIPHTILFGDSPSGLGATGRAEERVWFDQVKSIQTVFLTPKIDRVMEVMLAARAGPTGGNFPDSLDWDFVALFQLTETEQADLDKTKAETDTIDIDAGILDAAEARKKRFPDLEEERPGAEAEMQAMREEVTAAKKAAAAAALVPGQEPTATSTATPAPGEAPDTELQDAIKSTMTREEYSIHAPHVPVDKLDRATRKNVITLILERGRFKSDSDAREWATSNGFRADHLTNGRTFEVHQSDLAGIQAGSISVITLTRGVKAIIGKRK